MRTFNRAIYIQHLKDLKALDQEDIKNTYYPWVRDLASGVSTYNRTSGVLNRNDIIQEAYLAFELSWEKLNWELIKRAPDAEQGAIIWGYLKKSISRRLKNTLSFKKDGIRTHSSDGRYLGEQKTDLLTVLFPNFFKLENTMIDQEVTSWEREILAEALEEVMRKYLSHADRNLLEMFYGIDCPKATLKQIAKSFKVKESAIRKRKQRALETLRNQDVKKIIQKYFE